ncbi:MAG TPA: DUF1570 domain-containing protein [Isosphaeraceae bacterium]|jgi:hypothetical protein|nr:DUF1570 domain-containing protein [Isosphaeraceae bacterium]
MSRRVPTKAAEFPCNRRVWLAGLGAAWLAHQGSALHAQTADDPKAEKEVRDRAKDVGIKTIFSHTTAHYVGIGNAPDRFILKALQICESLERDYRSHFAFKGFAVRPPARRLTVVALADAKSYAAFSGQEPVLGEGGHYDIDNNRLIIFDNRAQGELTVQQAERANLISLVHEAMHQLTFNTGLLDREADVPLAISEGLATYAEQREPVGSTRLGQKNHGRLDGLRMAREKDRNAWIPVSQLLTDDKPFLGEGSELQTQLAYAESWVLVYELLKPAKPAHFRDYLEAVATRNDASHRLDDAKQHLGDLTKLDRQLQQAGAQML